MKLLPLFLAASAIASGCGVRIQEEKKVEVIDQLPNDAALADRYFVQDLDCQAKGGLADVGSQSIFQWQEGASRSTKFAFDGTSATDTLKSSAVSATFYDFRQVKTCVDGDLETCDGESKTIGTERALRICTQAKAYDRVSVEGVALSSLASINQAEAFYRGIEGQQTSILAAYLLVLPSIEKQVKDRSGAVVKREISSDNLAYVSEFGGSPVFVVYPKSREAVRQGLWKGLNLWEIPWVLAHEYGHHVFRTHTGVVSFTRNAKNLGLALVDRDVGDEDVWDAANEGYADLFAYYALGGKTGQTDGLDCFEKNRDVGSPVFADGRVKALDREVLGLYFSETKGPPRATCNEPNLQDEHAIGAIIAHGIARLFGASGEGDVSSQSAYLLAWSRRLGDLQRADRDASLDFDAVIEEALLTVAPNKDLNAAQCAVVKAVFPAYAEDRLADAFKCP